MQSTPPSALPPAATELLARVFGHQGLRPGQAEALRAVLAGRDVLVVLPTGGGKSLCFQLPALLDPPGLTLVVSPLIALMADQVAALRARGVAAAALHAQVPAAEAAASLRAACQGRLRLLYLAPERLAQSPALRAALARAPLRRVVVDEAHCVIRWGPDFRPDYLELGPVLAELGQPQLVAATATASARDQHEILRALGRPGAARVCGGLDRPEIFFAVRAASSQAAKVAALRTALARADGAVLVYTGTRSEAEQVASLLARREGIPAAAYHAGLPAPERGAVQAAFLEGRLALVAATSAFGMGIDKPDIRAVVHWTLPLDLCEYWQAVGRAGRDGKPALGLLFYSPEDRRLREWQIAEAAPSTAELAATYIAVAQPGDGSLPLEAASIAARAGLTQDRARACLTRLRRAELVRSPGGSAWCALRAPRPGELELLARAAAEHARERRRRLAEVIAYGTGGRCRRRQLLAEISDEPPLAVRPCCDVCHSASAGARAVLGARPAARAPAAPEPPAPDLRELDQRVLAAIEVRAGSATVYGLVKELAASGGAGSAVEGPLAAIRAAVNRLVEARMVVVHHGARPARLALTRRGRSAAAASLDGSPARRYA